MKNNKKTILLILLTITTLILLSTASATQDTNTTTTTSSIKEKTTTTEPVVKEVQKQEQNPEKQATKNKEKIIKENKTEKQTKKDSITIEVTDRTSFSNAISSLRDTVHDEGIIELTEGTYNLTGTNSPTATGNTKKIIINGNNQTMICPNTIFVSSDHTLILNSLTITNSYGVWVKGGELILNNTNIYLDSLEIDAGNTIIYDNSNLYFSETGYGVYYTGGSIHTNDTTLIQKLKDAGCPDENINPAGEENKNKIIENQNISKGITIQPEYNYTYINCNITSPIITNNGNLSIINSNVDMKVYSYSSGGVDYYSAGTLTNNGNITIINSTIIQSSINNVGDLFIDNCKSNWLSIGCDGNLTIKNSNLSLPSGIGATINHESTINIINSTLYNCSNSQVINAPTSNVTIENSTFKDNRACVLAYKTRINNTQFINNKYASSSRGLIDCGTWTFQNIARDIIIENSTFKNNIITNTPGLISGPTDYTRVYNCTFEDNYMVADNAWSKFGGVSIDIYPYNNAILNVLNNTFRNNHLEGVEGQIVEGLTYYIDMHTNGWGTDINIDTIVDGGYDTTTTTNMTIIIENNTFNHSQTNQKAASILINLRNDSHDNNIEITNNKFTNTQSISETIILNNTDNVLMENNKYTNSTIDFDNLVIEDPGKLYAGDTVTLKANIKLSNPKYYDQDILEHTRYNWYIDGENTTTDTPEYTLTVTNDSMIIYVTPSITNTRSQLLVLNPTVLSDKIITPENIEEYLFLGQLVKISENTKVIFQGDFINQGEICIKTNNLLLDGSNATFTNTSFLIEANDTTIQNMNINNKDTSNYIISNTGNNNIIRNNKLTTYNTQGLTTAIKDLNSKNTIITQNTITVTGPARDITGSNGARSANTQAILSNNATQSTITYNNITVTNSTDPELAQFSTIEAITAPQGTKNTISYNNIQCTGARFNYGISLLTNIKENTISHNNITVTGYRYTNGIQIGDGAINNTVSNNQIKLTCLNTTPVDEAAISYGIYLTNQGETPSDNNTIIKNNIKINGIINYGMEIYTATNTQITDNTITLTGAKSMGIGYAHSPNSTITRNTIKTIDDSSIPINSITEEIQPLNTGIRIQQNSENILIENNTIQTYDKQGKDTCIDVDSNNVTIKDNNLTSSTKTGDNTIKTTQPDTTIEDNIAIEQNSTTQTTTEDLTIGNSTTITAQFYDDTYTPVGDGKAIFRVNGKTLRYDNGTVICVDVINGRAELPDVNITQEWTKEGTTIQAVYIGDNNNEPIITTPTNVTVTKPEATITLEAPTEATAGKEITLKAIVTDSGKELNSGRVAFKLNGKTLKDPKTGKALYANVVNGEASITYTIPEKTKAKEYVLTAVFTDTKYDRKEANSTLNVVKV